MAKKFFIEGCLAFIVLVSAVDIFWSVYLSDTLLEHEENPVAVRVIIAGDYAGINGVALLCGLKGIGTFVVLGICRWICARSRRIGVPVVLGVAVFQLWLLYYLHFGVGFWL